MADIPFEQMQVYKRTARLRWQAEEKAREQRRTQAQLLARQAAAMLKADFGVQRVVLFGSLLQSQRFFLSSDVDLAAWGLTSANWLKAIAAVRNLSDEIDLNLVDVEACSAELYASIEQHGVPL